MGEIGAQCCCNDAMKHMLIASAVTPELLRARRQELLSDLLRRAGRS